MTTGTKMDSPAMVKSLKYLEIDNNAVTREPLCCRISPFMVHSVVHFNFCDIALGVIHAINAVDRAFLCMITFCFITFPASG
jgi:hypothetical protein